MNPSLGHNFELSIPSSGLARTSSDDEGVRRALDPEAPRSPRPQRGHEHVARGRGSSSYVFHLPAISLRRIEGHQPSPPKGRYSRSEKPRGMRSRCMAGRHSSCFQPFVAAGRSAWAIRPSSWVASTGRAPVRGHTPLCLLLKQQEGGARRRRPVRPDVSKVLMLRRADASGPGPTGRCRPATWCRARGRWDRTRR